MTLAPVNEPIVITQFEVLLGDIQDAKSNAVESFDYEDSKGEKEARSYIFGLRKIRAKIESCRKDAKSYALAYGKKVDEQAKSLVAEIDNLIQPHQLQLDAIARQEAERIASHQKVLDRAIWLGHVSFDQSALSISAQLEQLDGITVEGLEEFSGKTAAAIIQSRQSLQKALAKAVQAEQEAAELARLRAETEAREKQSEQERFEREAREAADREAEAAAQEAIKESERKAAEAEAKAEAAEAKARDMAAEAEAKRSAVATRDRLLSELITAMSEMSRQEVAKAIVSGSLHPAVFVDWRKA